ncbi:MAG: hypothetical protein WA820_14750, partial [Bradyrhizobium sp.]
MMDLAAIPRFSWDDIASPFLPNTRHFGFGGWDDRKDWTSIQGGAVLRDSWFRELFAKSRER